MSIALTTDLREVMHNRAMTKMGDTPPEEITSLADRLAWAIERKDTNPNKMELSTGIPRQTFYAVLRGQTQNFTWPILVKTCEHLGVRPEWMADGELPVFPAPEIKDEEEAQLIQDFRAMSPRHQKDLSDIASRWAHEDDDGDGRPARSFQHPKPQKQ